MLDGELHRRRLASDAQAGDPQSSLGGGERGVLLEEAPPLGILSERGSLDPLPAGAFDGDEVLEERRELTRARREKLGRQRAQALGAAPRPPHVSAATRVEAVLDRTCGEVEHRRLARVSSKHEPPTAEGPAKCTLDRSVRPRPGDDNRPLQSDERGNELFERLLIAVEEVSRLEEVTRSEELERTAASG
jgi:hypothetical protein